MMQTSKCPDCSGTELKLIGKLPDSYEFSGKLLDSAINGGNLYLCPNCELKFRFPILSNDEYNKLYNTENSNWVFDEERNDWKILNHFISEKIPDKGKILDFGCNLGDVLLRIPDKYEKYGIEINKSSAEIARKKANATVWNGLEDIPEHLKFDLIFAIDVIEHLASPREFVLSALPYLKEGGYIALLTGDSNNFYWKTSGTKWWYSTFPEHIAFISEMWAKKLDEKINGLEVLKSQNYFSTNKPASKKIKWFLVWTINMILGSAGKYLFNLSAELKKSGMGEMKHFGRNFSADHLFVVFKKS